MKYACCFRAPDGSTREIVVTLSADERADCARNFPTAAVNPLSLSYAWRKATQEAPFPEFEPLFGQALLVH
jgi:hypothetical protein